MKEEGLRKSKFKDEYQNIVKERKFHFDVKSGIDNTWSCITALA